MKKIISLLIATALSVTAFTSLVSAELITPLNKATLSMSYVEIDEDAAPAALQSFAEDLEDYSYYRFTITAGNLPQLTKTKKIYDGEGITAVSARVTVTSTAKYNNDWTAKGSENTSLTREGSDFIFQNYAGDSTYKTLVVTKAVAAGGSLDLFYFDVVVDNDYSYNFVLSTGSNMNAAVYSETTSDDGASVYNITLDGGKNNIEVDTTPIALNSAPATVDVTSVTISGATAATVGDNVQLSAEVLPANATDPTVTWTKVSGDGEVSTSGVVTANSAGDVVVKATAGGVDSANYTVSFAAPAPTPVYTDSSIAVKESASGKTGLTDLQGKDVTLTANYGIAKFSKAIDTVANKYFVVATDSNDVEKEFEVDFAANGVEISNASTTFFAIVKSADHIIKSIRLKEIAR